MIVRRAERADIKVLSTLAMRTYTAAFGRTFKASDLADHLERNCSEAYFTRHFDDDVVLVAEDADCLVGYVKFGSVGIPIAQATHRDQELQRLYVDPGFQRKGIGRALMNAALAHPRLAGAESIYLDVWEQNAGARKLYESFGFEVIGRNAFVVGSQVVGHDLVMVRRSSSHS